MTFLRYYSDYRWDSRTSDIMGWANVGWPIVLTQILSLSIAGTAISSTYLAQSYSIDVPTLQSVLSYALLAFVYIPYYAIKGKTVFG